MDVRELCPDKLTKGSVLGIWCENAETAAETARIAGILEAGRWVEICIYRVPTAQGKQGKWPNKIPCQGKHREFGNFAKTQVVNSLILKVKHILIFATKISISFKVCQVSFVSVIVINHVNWHRENLLLYRENTGKTQGI